VKKLYSRCFLPKHRGQMHIRRTFPNHYGTKVTSIVLRILRGEDIPKEIKYTFIVLIPKVASPSDLGQFLPISLCNVIYKIA
jgi:hypothetical protein